MIAEPKPVVEHGTEKLLGVRWLIRLRWVAALGQIAVCLVCAFGLGIRLPVGVLVACIGFLIASNAALALAFRRRGSLPESVKVAVVATDVIVFTVMLYFTGGAHNPFTTVYLLHVTMAVILLPWWAACGTVALCTLGFGVLFFSHHPLISASGATCCSDMDAHLRGMVVGLLLTGGGIAYFVNRLTTAIRDSRHTIALAQADGEQARRSIEVATLAASVAHELATPLGTIAVVSKDLEEMAGGEDATASWKEDARVIRQEVERCHAIIEKLGKAAPDKKETLTPIDWASLPSMLEAYLPEAIRGRLETRVRPSAKHPLVPVSRLLQCISILVKNAAEASPPGAPVILEAEVAQETCAFRIIDQGPGFPPDIVHRIGEPLVTTKSAQGGLGLGLYLVQAFARDLGGRLQVVSENGSRTVVLLTIPLRESQT